MARHTGPVCKLCRREGLKLYLKGERCDGPKCSFSRRDYAPGMHAFSRRRGRVSEYGIRLREKQKLKRYYGVLERQFRTYFHRAERTKGNTGETLLALLEQRLDNVVYRLGFAPSRAAARQLVNHGHIQIKGRRCDIASALVKVGQTVSVRDGAQERVKQSVGETHASDLPGFLERTDNPPEGRMVRLPARDDIVLPVREQLIVEFCSR